MGSPSHLQILEQGHSVWNTWRKENPSIVPDLSHANLDDKNLRGFDFTSCNLTGVKLNRANLRGVYMRNADLSLSHLSSADLSMVNFVSANLSKANIRQANLSKCNLRNTKMWDVNLHETNLRKAIFDNSDLRNAHLIKAQLRAAKFRNTNLYGADLEGADLRYCVFIGANLQKANLRSVNLTQADLTGANLREANISHAIIVQANLENSDLSNCRVYGLSAWDVKLNNAIQRDLIITRYHEPIITVDNIEVAQFIYLLLHNEKIRDIIDTVTSKVVLILGRFTLKRKLVLNALREELRKYNYSPIIFDFGPLSSRDMTETISTLAHLARFIIVDLTSPRSVPQEIQAIVPTLSVPLVPIISHSSSEYGMFESFKKYPWVLGIFRYKSKLHLIKSLETSIISPAETILSTLRH
jgi:uncharacterized protein YjbI with pentapeptide repeats